MSSASQAGVSGVPSGAAVRKQLEQVLSSATFAKSDRLGRFLAFVVEETLAGRGESLKESVITRALYSVESGGDSVVRVDARRLRDKLREFYTEYPQEAIRITLPKGGYIPQFEWTAAEQQVKAPENPPRKFQGW